MTKVREHNEHYKMLKYDVIDIGFMGDLDFTEFSVLKYIVRAGFKDGEPIVKDLEKAATYINRLLARRPLSSNCVFRGHTIKSYTTIIREHFLDVRKKIIKDKAEIDVRNGKTLLAIHDLLEKMLVTDMTIQDLKDELERIIYNIRKFNDIELYKYIKHDAEVVEIEYDSNVCWEVELEYDIIHMFLSAIRKEGEKRFILPKPLGDLRIVATEEVLVTFDNNNKVILRMG